MPIQRVVLDVRDSVFQNRLVMIVEPKQRICRSSSFVLLLKVRLFLWVRPVVGLQSQNRVIQEILILKLSKGRLLTFLRGRPLPLPLVGGARTSPSGPFECFYFICV